MISPEGSGPGILLRITRNQGEAVRLVDEKNSEATVVAVRKINELEYYCYGLRDVARKLARTEPKLLVLIEELGLQSNSDMFKVLTVGSLRSKRYSVKAVDRLRAALQTMDLEALWRSRKAA